jgi:hypothetical protein
MYDKLGFSPELRKYEEIRNKALAGDIVFKCTPATVTPVPRATAWTRKVIITLETSGGDIHEWFNKAITSGVSITDTSSAGTATIPSTTLTFEKGKAEVTITGSAHNWLNTETDTLTVAQATILGYTVASKTSVETFTTA